MSEFGEAALRYAHLGLAVIPVIPHEKNPIFTRWQEIATADIAIVSRWWKQNPNANVGIATGQRSRLFVFDVDTKSGGMETYEQLVFKHGRPPDTWQQTTGSGGFHLFFRYPNFRVSNAAGLFQGIDIRGDGGQVVAPPSIHPNGKRYEWDGTQEIEHTPLAEAPPWLLDALQQKNQRTHSDKFPIALQIPKGVQHETLVAMAGMMRKLGLSPAEIFPSLMEVNRQRCQEPGPAENISKIADSMDRYRPSDADLFTTANRLWRVTKAKECEVERERAKNEVRIVDGLTVYRAPVAEYKCIVDKVLYHGLTVFAGRPKVGKSWLALQLALSVAHGGMFLGGLDVLSPGRVVYVALEESQARTAGRMRKLQGQEDILLQNISMVYSLKPLMAGGAEQLNELLDNQKPNLVIIDTFLAIVGGDKGKRDVMRSEYAEIALLKSLAEKYETGIVLVHHLRKAVIGEAVLDAVAGSTGITAAADCVWGMKREDAALCSLEAVGREVEQQVLALRFGAVNGIGWSLEGIGEQVKDARDEREIMTLLSNEGSLSCAKIATLLKMNANRTRSILYALYQRGVIQRNTSGTYYMSPIQTEAS